MRVATRRWFHRLLISAATPALLLCSAAWADSTDGGQSSVWTQKEFTFVYYGFTTRYSCDGLRDKVRTILLEFGARKDNLQVTERGCVGRTGVPDPFPGVAVKMSVLVPAYGLASEPAVPSHWKPLKLKLDPDRSNLSEAGECELVEQVQQKILPLFTTRNVDYRSTCVPHQLTPGGTVLNAEVLAPDQTKVGAGAAH